MARQAKVAHMQQGPKTISAAIIAAFFEGSDAVKTSEKIAQVEGSRIAYLRRYFEGSDVSAVKQAVKQYKDSVAAKFVDLGGKSSKEGKVASTRAGEIQTLYGGWRFAKLSLEGVGYHAAVQAARDALKAAAVKWDGTRIPSKDEKDDRKAAEQEGRIAMLVEMEKRQFERANPGEEVTPDKLAEFRSKNAESLKRAGAVEMARRMFEKQGPEFCGWLIDSLEALIAESEQGEQEPQKAAA